MIVAAQPPFVLDPDACGLIVVDMQNDFVRQGAPQEVPDARSSLPAIQRLLKEFRNVGKLVVYTKFIAGPEETLMWLWSPECAPPQRSCWRGVTRSYLDVSGEVEGAGIVEELSPEPGDMIVEKYGYSAFHRTNLDDVLTAHHVTDVVISGTVTQICVADTAHGAFHHGYRTVVISDAVSSYDDGLHEATLRNVDLKYGRVLTVDEVLVELAGRA